MKIKEALFENKPASYQSLEEILYTYTDGFTKEQGEYPLDTRKEREEAYAILKKYYENVEKNTLDYNRKNEGGTVDYKVKFDTPITSEGIVSDKDPENFNQFVDDSVDDSPVFEALVESDLVDDELIHPDDISNEEDLFVNEDTIKQNGKWVNKGKEGTHGKFKTKKAADDQRKAMFANGYHESLNTDVTPEMIKNGNHISVSPTRQGINELGIGPDDSFEYERQDDGWHTIVDGEDADLTPLSDDDLYHAISNLNGDGNWDYEFNESLNEGNSDRLKKILSIPEVKEYVDFQIDNAEYDDYTGDYDYVDITTDTDFDEIADANGISDEDRELLYNYMQEKVYNESLNESKKLYHCDDCGYEVELSDDEYDGKCPNCGEHHGFYEVDESLNEGIYSNDEDKIEVISDNGDIVKYRYIDDFDEEPRELPKDEFDDLIYSNNFKLEEAKFVNDKGETYEKQDLIGDRDTGDRHVEYGINWVWFYTDNKRDAIRWFKQLTGALPYESTLVPPVQREHPGKFDNYWKFRMRSDIVSSMGDLKDDGGWLPEKDFELEETIEKHDDLNRDIFGEDDKLIPEVREKLMAIAQRFMDNLKEDGIEIEPIDIVLLGSNASYNYTPASDLDTHIIADMSMYEGDEDLALKLYQAYKSLFNQKFDPMIKGHECEIYVEPDKVSANSNGIYSIMNDQWLKEPDPSTIPEVDMEPVNSGLQPYLDRFEEIKNNPSIDSIDQLIDDLYLLRQQSILQDGEYAVGNLIFKEFRNQGLLQELKDMKVKEQNKEMSLESLNEGQTEDGYVFGFADPEDTLKIYLDWEGIYGYLDDILMFAPDGYDAVNDYLEEEGIYGYTDKIMRILEEGECYCPDIEEEDFEELCRANDIDPEENYL